MKLLILADLHEVYYREWQEFLKIDHSSFDIMALLGDIDIMFYKSISENFSNKQIIGVLGNHDYTGDLEHYGLTNLHGKTITVSNITLSGVEGCVKYKSERNTPIHTQEEIIDVCSRLDKCDILLSHNSPKGIHDKEGIAHEGYIGLAQYLNNLKPQYCIHGHQHVNILSDYKGTKVLGVYGGIILDTDTGQITKIL